MINDLDKKQRQIRVRLSPNEHQALDIMARRDGRTWSDMLRECIREAAARRGLNSIGLTPVLGEKQLTQEATN